MWGHGVRLSVACLVLIGILLSLIGCLPKEMPGGNDQATIDQTQSPSQSEPSLETETEEVPPETPASPAMSEVTLDLGSTMINEPDGAALMYVPAGEFLMGSESELAFNNEAPAHIVTLDAFWIYKFEITNAQYRACITENSCQGDANDYPENDLPVVNITWFEADAYCTAMGGRLPTEAEWEKAARGTDDREFPWGDESPTCDLAYMEKCGPGKIPVGSLPDGVSPYGVMDMSGNAWEWVADWYDFYYYEDSPNTNPTGPVEGEKHVVRGVTWYPFHRSMRVSYRWSYYPENSYSTIGFRCVVDP